MALALFNSSLEFVVLCMNIPRNLGFSKVVDATVIMGAHRQ